MSQCLQSSDGFIKGLFSPRVAVLCSQDADIISQRNNLSFSELIQPFCSVNSEIQVHDPNNQTFVIRDLRLSICDLRAIVPDENAVKQLLLSVVGDASTSAADQAQTISVANSQYAVNVNASCPWFDVYRETVTSLAHPKLHEFISHCIACLLVVSSAHPNPIEEFGNLSQQQNHIQHQSTQPHIRWMTPNTLKYYVLVHDSSCADSAKAQQVISDLQAMHGKNVCSLLCINSKVAADQQNIPDPWSRLLNRKMAASWLDSNGLNMKSEAEGAANSQSSDVQWMSDLKQSSVVAEKGYGCCLTLQDHESLRKFMHEFASNGLIPHVEKIIRNCSEQIASRKAIHKSIFRATRSFFGGSKTASAPSFKTLPGGAESPELQTRKLADLFFLCQMYEHAFYYYHAARKDFSSEQRWLHAAGASEMAAFTNFMQVRSQRLYPAHYVDTAIETYLVNCNDQYLPLRCAFVSLECLRQKGLYNEAASQLLKLSNDDDDLKSAVLLEQIAHCFLRGKRPLLRKFAFHLVLAGHRYGKASLRTCALLCYKAALQVYRRSGWTLAEDHINFTLGRQSYNLQQLEFSVKSFECLLVSSKQSAPQQAAFLHEYLVVANRHSVATKTTTSLSLPKISLEKSLVRSGVSVGLPGDDRTWVAMEKCARRVAEKQSGNNGMFFENSSKAFEAVVDEVLLVDIHVTNSLGVALALFDSELVFQFTSTEGVEKSDSVEAPVVREAVVAGNAEAVVTFAVMPHCTGTLLLTGMSYKLAIAKQPGFTPAAAAVELRGVQSFSDDLASGLSVTVFEPMPLLTATVVSDFPATLFHGEIQQVRLTFTNSGKREMRNFKMAFDPRLNCLLTDEDTDARAAHVHFLNSTMDDAQDFSYVVQSLSDKVLKPSESVTLVLWIQGGYATKPFLLHFLFYYEPPERRRGQMQYRTLKYCSRVGWSKSIDVTSSVTWDVCQTGATVAVNAKHLCPDSSKLFSVADVVCNSTDWSLVPIRSQSMQPLLAGQVLKFCFKVEHSTPCRRAGSLSATSGLQRINLQGAAAGDDASPGVVTDSQTLDVVLHGVGKDGTISPLSLPGYLKVAVTWTAAGSPVVGQHYMRLRSLKSDVTSLAKLGLLESPSDVMASSQSLAALHQLVKWSVEYGASAKHNFARSTLCVVPVRITLRNMYDCELRVKVDGLDANQNPTSNTLQFLWMGKVLSKFSVAAYSSKQLCLNACFAAPGVYNLNALSVWAVPAKLETISPLLPQNCQYACLVTICDSSR